MHDDRVMEFVDLDAVDTTHPGIPGTDHDEEAVGHRRSRASADADMDLIDERGAVMMGIASRDNAHARWLDWTGRGLSEAGRKRCDCALHRIGDVVGEVGGGHRAGCRMPRHTDAAILPDQYVDPPEATGIGGDVVIEYPVEDPDHCRTLGAWPR